jgi:[protein-PII] uridylyltransferase
MLAPPKHRRTIISRKLIDRQLDALDASLTSAERRAAVLEIAKTALAAGRAEVKKRFEAGESGAVTARAQSYLIDQLMRIVFDDTTQRVYPASNPTASERLSLVAVGGYGRGEMAPYSDVDLLFLLPYKQTPRGEQIAEHMLYLLWDLGLKVGHATRSIDSCISMARADVTVRTALLEARYIWGEQDLFLELRRRFAAEIITGTTREFVEAKLSERDLRHERMGDSRYVLEPNIKEGKGGLRDLHTLFWIAKYAYRVDEIADLTALGVLTQAEATTFAKAHSFLWTLRCHLHYLLDRAEERLTFDVQAELARRMKYTDHAGTRGVERFMKHYFLIAKYVGDLTRIFCAALEAEQQKRKPKISIKTLWKSLKRDRSEEDDEQTRQTIEDPDAFLADPVNFVRIFWTAERNGTEIHPAALRLISQNLKRVDKHLRGDPEANRLFLEILTSPNTPEVTLRRMNEAGVLGRFVPDFGRVVAQMQYDMYHVFTVDEHTLFAIGMLSRIEHGQLKDELPLATSLLPAIQSRRALFVATMLHDIAKGRGGDHSVLGEAVANRLCPRLGLTQEETETIAWLVRFHLLMSNTAFRRDLQDPKTIADFVAQVQSPERLKLLYILTIADIRAVGPKVWNNWKATLLTQLYNAAEDLMVGPLDANEGPAPLDRRLDAVAAMLKAELMDWSNADFATHWALGTPSYWLSADPKTLARHARLVRRAKFENAPLAVDTLVDPAHGVTDVTIYAGDHPGVFARIAGAFAVAGANIVDAKIFTLANGMVLDSFSLQDAEGGAFDRPERLARFAVLIEQALSGRLRSMADLRNKKSGPSRTQIFTVTPRVLIDNKASATNTVIEVNGRDRPGFLHDVCSALTRLNLQITSAKISTYGERAVDVFYVKDIFGLKVDQEQKLHNVRKEVLAAVTDPDQAEKAQAAE